MKLVYILSLIVNIFILLGIGLSLVLPRWVVGSYRGNGHAGFVDFNVDVQMGDGLWRRNVCFGKSAPEDLLNKAGLSCKGSSQTNNCGADHKTDDKKEECTMFYAAESLQVFAMFFAFCSCVIACVPVPSKRGLMLSNVLLIVTGILIIVVLRLLQNTYLYDNHERVRLLPALCRKIITMTD